MLILFHCICNKASNNLEGVASQSAGEKCLPAL